MLTPGYIKLVSSGAKIMAKTIPFKMPNSMAQPSCLLLRTSRFVKK